MTVNEDMADLLKVFGDADKLVINFPQGDEQSGPRRWTGAARLLRSSCTACTSSSKLPAPRPSRSSRNRAADRQGRVKQADDGGI